MSATRSAAGKDARAPATREASGSITSLLLTPFLTLAFALLHIVYQLVLLARRARDGIRNAIKRRPNRPPASFTCLEEMLTAHECPLDTIKVPQHLAVVLADAAPSSIRLYLSALSTRLGRRNATQASTVWREYRAQYEAAIEAKRTRDVAAIVHLARISGVKQLSVHTSQPLSSSALQSLTRTLQTGYKTRANVSHETAHSANADQADSWSRYAELRRRTNRSAGKSSGSSSASSPGSPASSDSEAGPSSLDETLASSYTAESDALSQQDAFDAAVDIRVGLDRPLKADESNTEESAPATTLQVTLLNRQDGQQRLAHIISSHIHSLSTSYLSSTLVPDMDSAASSNQSFSSSALRKSWVSKRSSFTSQLTVDQLDATLSEAGYLGEPELLVVFGGRPRARQLYGFPAWPLRVTDLFYDANSRSGRPYGSEDFVKALRKLAGAEQRYGR